jgi:PAS domain S-box-containing protein
MSPEDAAQARRVSVRGVVTQTMPEWRGFSIQDDTDAVYVAVPQAQILLPKTGDYAEVRGVTGAGNFAPIIQADSVARLGTKMFPKPIFGNWSTLSSGACDNRLIEVTGVVRSVMTVQPPRWRWRATAIHIDLGGNLIWAYVRDASLLRTQELGGATVRIKGTCLVLSNSRRQFERNALLVANGSDIVVTERSAEDPFSFPLSNINRLFLYRPDRTTPGRVRVSGTITWISGTRLFIQNEDGSLQVTATTDTGARIGQCIDVVGFPAPGTFSTILEDALTRPCEKSRGLLPLEFTARGIMSRTKDNKPALPDATLVRLEATVLDVSRSAREQILTLEDSNSVFTARMLTRGKSEPSIVKEGARIRLTGVCVIQVDDVGLARSFEILLRSRRDISVISGPSWLTRSLAIRILIGMLAAALLGLLWITLLRRRVRLQTAVIRDQLSRESALETRIRHLVEHASDMVYILDANGTLLHVNSGAERLTGYTCSELLQRNILDLLVTDQRAEAARKILCGTPNEVGFEQSEWRFLRKDGSEMTIELSQRIATDSAGCIRIEAIGRDVTARNEATAEQRDRFRALADNIPQLAWMADCHGTAMWYNQRWFQYTAIPIEKLTRRGWISCIHSDHLKRVEDSLLRNVEAGETWQDTFLLCGADGRFRWFLGRAVPIRDSTGRVVRWFGTNTDITEQKQIESELKRSNSDLRQFAYIASHDLQEPLRNIYTFTQLLSRTFQNGDLTPHRAQCIETVLSGTQRMVALIRDLLQYSQVTGMQDVELRPIDLEVVFTTVLTNLEASIRETGASITHDALPTIVTDAGNIGRVLQNLFANALKYSRSGVAPSVHLSALRGTDAWVFTVRDNGCGFDQAYAERIFGIFKRLHGQEKSGTGVGLAICKAIIERAGGRIWAESQPGVGAHFHFSIPDSPPSFVTEQVDSSALDPAT